MSKVKSNSVITTEIDEAAGTITYTVLGAGSITLHMDKVHPDNQRYAAFHGFKQRVPDAAALSRNPDTGKPASPAEKLAEMQELVDHYESGTPEWSRRREGGGATSSLLFRVLVAYKIGEDGVSDADACTRAKAFIAAFEGDKKALLYSERLKPYREAAEAAMISTNAAAKAEEMLAGL